MKMNTVKWMCLSSWLVCAAALPAERIPADGDAWSDYSTAAAAIADGWTRTCAQSQQIMVYTESNTGDFSVGCQAIQSRWDKPFSLVKSAPLTAVTQLRFAHKESWANRTVYPRIYMTPTPEEAAAGIVAKRIDLTHYTTALEWTDYVGVLADGTWRWEDSQLGWITYGPGNTILTTLTGIEWFANYIVFVLPTEIGDSMRIDGLNLITSATACVGIEQLHLLAAWWMSALCGIENAYCQGTDCDLDGDVDLDDFAALSERWLAGCYE